VKNTQMFLPSLTTLGEAGEFDLCSSCWRGRGASLRHSTLPDARSRQIVNSFWPSNAVTKIRSPARTGDEWPEGSGVFQTTFFAGPNSTGRFAAVPTPEELGP